MSQYREHLADDVLLAILRRAFAIAQETALSIHFKENHEQERACRWYSPKPF
jgi:DNA recombination-dependent growth factor C